ncbi:hypothetical protein GGX14DRAFT_458971 [Mycena pura]|uniref:Protein-S-isoprenylcysteine O-methyltransferase n=1 Tax=Mycena pura TaxID=153505 RepID=A0AAD6VBH1_9AGAR|nr:hypothetical protein GGX14DRAFT_458971 [Mycena pura]
MATLKIPLLLSVMLGTHVTMTPPNPPPSKGERLHPSGLEHFAPRLVPVILTSLFWTCGLAEITIIAARQVSPASVYFPLAKTVLGALDRTGGAPYLKLTPMVLLGCVLNLVGAGIRIHCYRRLRSLFTFELGIHEGHHLITDGVYGIVRHPSYTGALFVGVGIGLCTLTPGTWAIECTGLVRPGEPWSRKVLAIWVVGLSVAFKGLASRMRKEDKMLRERFGAEWEAWAARVPCKIFPSVY